MGGKQIAAQLRVSVTTITRDFEWLRKRGYDLGKIDRERYAEGQIRTTSNPANDPAHIAQVKKEIVDLRLAGYQTGEIAESLGVSGTVVRKHLRAVFESLTTPNAETLRQIESDRLDRLLVGLQGGILAGDIKAIEAAIKVSERRAMLYGLNQPIRIEHTVLALDTIDAEIERLSQQLMELGAAPDVVEGSVIDG